MLSFWRRALGSPVAQTTEAARALAPMPIIVGTPRSGTTLLRFMLDAHPDLAIPPETGFLKLAPRLRGGGDDLREKFFRAVVNYPEQYPSWPDFGIPEAEFRAALAEISPFNVSEGFRAFYRLYAARHAKPRYGDKTPLYCMEIAAIRRILPEARFVHIIRDGRDVALSLRRQWFSPGYEIETQARYWRKTVTAARRAGRGRPDYFELRYEDLVLKTRETLGRVCEFLALEYDERMLDYYKGVPERLEEHKGRSGRDGAMLMTDEQRRRQQQRTTEPPDPALVYAWRSRMSADESARYARVAGGLLRELGYEA
ncbi:MAG TPA: sulfotransferase [Pyrinomonadaceae bacterium]|nr:sulfotransferase [Pyrinomonadaceae bacterium]